MQFLSRVFGTAPKTSPVRRADRSPRSRCSQISVESLEGRNLMSIPGVSVVGGALQITATQASHNAAYVWKDQNQNVNVWFNGNTQVFPAGSLYTVTYTGGPGGYDTFANYTNLTEMAMGYGGGNQFRGGSSWNVCYLYGNYNSYDAQGGPSEVLTYNGPNDQITPYSDVYVYQYSFQGW
jgi:hypothetical protein